MTIAAVDAEEWVGANFTARVLSIGTRSLPRVAALMGIRARTFPGRRGPMYNRQDLARALERLMAEEDGRIEAAAARAAGELGMSSKAKAEAARTVA